MSRFSDKVKKYTGISARDFAAVGTLGASEIGYAAADFAKDPTGAKAAGKKQVEALRKAGRIEEAQRLEATMFRAQIMSETAPFREQAQLELKRLSAQQPGETEFFKKSLESGTQAIAGQAAGFGLLDSGSTRRGFGELGAQLLSREELMRQQGMSSAAQQSQLGFGLGLGALQQQGGAAFRQAQTQANIGAVQAQGTLANRQFWLGLGTQVGGAALGSALGTPPIPTGATGGGGGQGTQGGYSPPQYGQWT